MQVYVNGEVHTTQENASLADLLLELQAPGQGIAVEVNRSIVRRKDHAQRALVEGDRVEIVGLVGGG